MFDVITIGSATKDAFIETDSANIVSVSKIDKISSFMAYPYGSKIEINNFSSGKTGLISVPIYFPFKPQHKHFSFITIPH